MKTLTIVNRKGIEHTVKLSDRDFERVSAIRWHITPKGYAVHTLPNHSKIYMHRFILGVNDSNLCVDHINGDPLDNRRENLRAATMSQNCANRTKSAGKTSAYKGVSKRPNGTYEAYIQENGKKKHIGYYQSELAAAAAYDKKALERFGAFALINFPPTLYVRSLYDMGAINADIFRAIQTV